MKKIYKTALLLVLVALLASCANAGASDTDPTTQGGEGTTSVTEAMQSSEATSTIGTTQDTETTTEPAPQTETTTEAITTTTAATTTTTAATTTTTEATTTAPAPAEIKPIKSILLHSYNAYVASFGLSGYTFYYYTPDMSARGETKKTPINTEDPLSTADMELSFSTTPAPGAFEALCNDLWELRFDLLPETIEIPENGPVVMDGWRRYLTIIFEDGSTFTSSGYVAEYYSKSFGNIYDRLIDYSKE